MTQILFAVLGTYYTYVEFMPKILSWEAANIVTITPI